MEMSGPIPMLKTKEQQTSSSESHSNHILGTPSFMRVHGRNKLKQFSSSEGGTSSNEEVLGSLSYRVNQREEEDDEADVLFSHKEDTLKSTTSILDR